MRTLDRNYLASHPEGDEKAVFTVNLSLPKSVDVADNPDGSRPMVTLEAISDTYMNLLGLLDYLHNEDVNDNAMALLLSNGDEEKLASFASIEDAAPYLREAVTEIITPFRTFTLDIELETEGQDEPVAAGQFKLTAPSVASAAQALRSMTRPHVLQELAISFSPETDDEDEYGHSNEVLVVS